MSLRQQLFEEAINVGAAAQRATYALSERVVRKKEILQNEHHISVWRLCSHQAVFNPR
jgi:hypothetical protein